MTWFLLMPTLAFAMSSCPLILDNSHKPCHDAQHIDGDMKDVMMLIDCLELDLFQVDLSKKFEHGFTPEDTESDNLFSGFVFSHYDLLLLSESPARAPPSLFLKSFSPSPVILRTLRIRI